MGITRSKIFRKLDYFADKNNRAIAGGLKDTTHGREKFFIPKPRLPKCDGHYEYGKASANVRIFSGMDRHGSCGSGKGGRGDTHASAFRIIVGHMGADAASVNSEGEPIAGHPSHTYDAATIYVSQKTDVDTEFLLTKGKMPLSLNRSAIALKADGIRIIAREGIKLITGADETNSQGTKVNSGAFGIDLIANNEGSGLQPLVKGHNLVKALDRMRGHIDELGGIVGSFLAAQMILNTFIQGHHHVSFVAGPTSPDPLTLQVAVPAANIDLATKCLSGLFMHKINSVLLSLSYLSPIGPGYICSMNNNTN